MIQGISFNHGENYSQCCIVDYNEDTGITTFFYRSFPGSDTIVNDVYNNEVQTLNYITWLSQQITLPAPPQS